MRMVRSVGLLVGALVLLSGPASVYADEASDTAKAAARSLGEQGLAALDEGDFARAADLLNRAYRTHRVPSLALWSGRVLIKVGKLVAAAERFREATRLDVAGGDAERQAAAQRDSALSLAELLPKIPSVTLQVDESVPEGAVLTVDGTRVSAAVIGTSIPIDPGLHQVTLSWDGVERKAEFRVGEAEAKAVPLVGVVKQGAAPADVPATGKPKSSTTPSDVGRRSSAYATVAWSALGVGAAGVAVGALSGVLAIRSKRSLSDACEDNQCPPEEYGALDRFRTERTVSTIGWLVGAVGVSVGVTFLLMAPSSADGQASRTAMYTSLGPNGWVVGGRY